MKTDKPTCKCGKVMTHDNSTTAPEYFLCDECADPMKSIKNTIGKAAYEAYCATRKWKSYDGGYLPQWDGVKPEIQAGWIAAAEAVILYTRAYIEDAVVSDIVASMSSGLDITEQQRSAAQRQAIINSFAGKVEGNA